MNLGIIGTGGFAREVLQLALDIQKTDKQFNEINFVMFDDFFEHEYEGFFGFKTPSPHFFFQFSSSYSTW